MAMRRIAALALYALAAPAHAATVTTYTTVTVVEEVVEDSIDGATGTRFVHAAPAHTPVGIARFGPFRVIDGTHAALVDATDERSPIQFKAMMAAFPGIKQIDFVECPGTDDDRANLSLGRMIRQLGLRTHVPAGGSVRSGAVELFLAGVTHTAEPTAEFAVHSWADDRGREAKDYPADAPENRAYLDYYHAMGMSDTEARAFYAMTNAVPNASARWLTAAQMEQWVRLR